MRHAVPGQLIVVLALDAFQLLGENRHAEIAGLHALDDAELQHLHDLLHRRTDLQCGLDVAARARGVHMRVGRVQGDAEQLDSFGVITPLA